MKWVAWLQKLKAEEQTSSYLVFCEVETSSAAQQDMIFWIP
jgi:hypothetical protein